jgi:RNA polymerase-binding transcription factor DksA
MHQQNFIDEMKQKLISTKAQFEEELAGLPEHIVMGDDREANADEVGPDEANQDVRALLQSDLKKIDIALEKIATGTYGTDDEGKEISEERLRVLPWADKAI